MESTSRRSHHTMKRAGEHLSNRDRHDHGAPLSTVARLDELAVGHVGRLNYVRIEIIVTLIHGL